ncbi:hypothetical protein [Natronoglycomyces albus]|uniref:Uncharacterized protein n=1 Tax=Natronoglycomyces albus TaxID=2811108 RepID=A0A895XTG5_9ACTN|nr:hypothetical protein [Natronoglycomyces albus]QSB04928.1 hypothetical protein JQS30_14355 [Natronoglycomyces albus]
MSTPDSPAQFVLNADDLAASGVVVDLAELDLFNQKMGELLSVLRQVDHALEKRDLSVLPGFASRAVNADMTSLPIGTFEDAVEVNRRYRESVFAQRRDEIGRILWGTEVCGHVAKNSRERYAATEDHLRAEHQNIEHEIDAIRRGKKRQITSTAPSEVEPTP